MTEGGPTVTSIARGGKNLGRPHQGAVQSNQELSEVLRAGRESTAGRSPLSTPDSFLMFPVSTSPILPIGHPQLSITLQRHL